MKETFSNSKRTRLIPPFLGKKRQQKQKYKHTQNKHENHLCKLTELVRKHTQINTSV